MALARGEDHRARFGVMAGRARLRRLGDLFMDLVIDRLRDLTHREVVVLDAR